MIARSRLKSRRGDVSTQSYSHHVFGYHRGSAQYREARAFPTRYMVDPPRVVARLMQEPVENKNILRLDGDSIAYFWALEAETAISYHTLVVHWRHLTKALRKSLTWD